MQRDGLAIDVAVEVKDIDLYRQLRTIAERGTGAYVHHALVTLSAYAHHHGISSIMRQNQAWRQLAHIGGGEAYATAIVETVNHSALKLKRMTHAVHGILHPAASDELTHYRRAHRSILAQIFWGFHHLHSHGLALLNIVGKGGAAVMTKAVVVAHHQGVNAISAMQQLHELLSTVARERVVKVEQDEIIGIGGSYGGDFLLKGHQGTRAVARVDNKLRMLPEGDHRRALATQHSLLLESSDEGDVTTVHAVKHAYCRSKAFGTSNAVGSSEYLH